jgi:putative membrane protein
MNVRTNSIVGIAATAALFIGASGVLGQGQTGAAAGTATRTAKPADQAFLTKAAMGGEAEVELGAMAQQKAADPKVKALGQRMETDHKKANADLRAIISAKGITVPGGFDKEHQAVKTRLDKLEGANFDRAYAAAMVDDHMKDIKEFEMAAKSDDPDIKGFAEKTLPTLREHLKMAQDTKAATGMPHPVSGTGATSGTTSGNGGNTSGR